MSPMKVVKLDRGIVKNVVEPTRILNTWFRILTAKKAASANRFSFLGLVEYGLVQY